MPESESMSTGLISTTREVDPAFREVVAMLYGDAVDVRQVYDLAKAAESASTRSVREKNERTQARVGLASNIVGLGAGVAGTAAALRDERFKHGGKIARELYAVGQKIPKPISGKAGKTGALLAGGALGLQVANMAGDVVANRVLARATKTPHQRAHVKKAFDDGLREIVAARRSRVIDSATAMEMAVNLAKSLEPQLEDVAKWDPAGIGRTIKTAATIQGQPFAVAPPVRIRLAARKARRLNPVFRANDRARSMTAAAQNAGKAKAYALRGTAALAGGGGATVGYKRGRKKGNTEVLEGRVTKAAVEQVDYGFTGEISKVDQDKRLVFGWCSLSEIDGEPVVDLQNDYAPIEEIEKSAYAYVLESRKGGDMHARDGEQPLHTSDLVESMIVTPDKLEQMGLSAEVAKSVPTGWWVGFKVNDEQQWQKVKNGERAGFSIHGKGNRVSKVLA